MCYGNCGCKAEAVEEVIDESAVMTGRLWIEFGKMFNNMVQAGYDVELNMLNDEEYYCVDLFKDNEIGVYGEDSQSPYLAIKDVYFKYFLGMEDCENIQLDIPEDTLAILYKAADKDGITIDEQIINILEEQIKSLKPKAVIESARCCFNCVNLINDGGSEPWCKAHNTSTSYNKCCLRYNN